MMLEEQLVMNTLGTDVLLGILIGFSVFLIYVAITEKIK